MTEKTLWSAKMSVPLLYSDSDRPVTVAIMKGFNESRDLLNARKVIDSVTKPEDLPIEQRLQWAQLNLLFVIAEALDVRGVQVRR
jgi:hypothetical protein